MSLCHGYFFTKDVWDGWSQSEILIPDEHHFNEILHQ